ncbi:hypothetical protein ABZP36_029282 [Zizania latifolia]
MPAALQVRREQAAAAMASPARIELDKLSVEQLKAVKEQTDLEVNLLQDSLTKIRSAATRLENAAAALHDLSLRSQGTAHGTRPAPLSHQRLHPSLHYLSRTFDLVLKTMAQGKEYCERKINLLKSNFDELVEMATKKKTIADEMGLLLQAKLRQSSPSSSS